MNLETMLAKAVFLVEANGFEQLALWRETSTESPSFSGAPVIWKQMNPGYLVQVGTLDERPVCVSFAFVEIDRQLVGFYEATSQVVDLKQIEEWLKANFLGTWDKGTRRAVTNAMNFHHCLNAIKELNK